MAQEDPPADEPLTSVVLLTRKNLVLSKAEWQKVTQAALGVALSDLPDDTKKGSFVMVEDPGAPGFLVIRGNYHMLHAVPKRYLEPEDAGPDAPEAVGE